ncbi:MAG: polysaccharide deacetylase family protein [Phycisphaeraceae bacterium]|nr:polysaccharide deacetylase family protein [Phycisphaeraceae bacterium]
MALAATAPKNKAFAWPKECAAAVSLSFDDARLTQVDTGLPLLDRLGVKASFYVSLYAFNQRVEQWKKAVANGHEVGNHTVHHPCSGNFCWAREHALEDYTLKQMEEEILEANRQIEVAIGVRPVTFAYPCGQTFVGRGEKTQSYVPIVARHFLAGRGFITESHGDPTFCDLAQIPARGLDTLTFDQVQPWIDDAAKQGHWLNLAGHEIGGGHPQTTRPETLEAIAAYCRQKNLWVDTVAAVSAYVKKVRGF